MFQGACFGFVFYEYGGSWLFAANLHTFFLQIYLWIKFKRPLVNLNAFYKCVGSFPDWEGAKSTWDQWRAGERWRLFGDNKITLLLWTIELVQVDLARKLQLDPERLALKVGAWAFACTTSHSQNTQSTIRASPFNPSRAPVNKQISIEYKLQLNNSYSKVSQSNTKARWVMLFLLMLVSVWSRSIKIIMIINHTAAA